MNSRYRSRKKDVDIETIKKFFELRLLNSDKKNELIALLENLKNLDVELEIGCGCGHFITQKATDNSNIFFLANELKLKIMKKVIRKAQINNLENLVFLVGDINNFLEYFPSDFLQSVYINFPDPWPKKRHHKRRLINQDFLNKIAEKMKKNAKLFFVTDNIEYLTYSIEQFKMNNYFICGVENYGVLDKLENYPQTLYETLFRKDGIKINYTYYIRK
ncbi:MAG TPA: tRNA (guanosine(46)-N7)-methyltransferase TrmB [bacterium]|nr:tRNA (guanosine(46)-N7)-methyltransferase TrmB [bacterium]HPP87563.1 tRNA (guanosine(46)-N7)-methyltransferase TrmB [bacterium]